MNYRIRFTRSAADDLQRLFDYLAEQDPKTAERAKAAIEQSMEILRSFPFTCRKATPDNPFLRELIIGFGHSGYIALFEVEDANTVTILAVRHQREDDYY